MLSHKWICCLRAFPPTHSFQSTCNSVPTPVFQQRLWHLDWKLIDRNESQPQWSKTFVFEGATHTWFSAVLCVNCVHTHMLTVSKVRSYTVIRCLCITYIHTYIYTHTHIYIYFMLCVLYYTFLFSERFFKFCSALKFLTVSYIWFYIFS